MQLHARQASTNLFGVCVCVGGVMQSIRRPTSALQGTFVLQLRRNKREISVHVGQQRKGWAMGVGGMMVDLLEVVLEILDEGCMKNMMGGGAGSRGASRSPEVLV